MRFFLALVVTLSVQLGYGLEKLDPKYCITYGNPDASVKVVEYFSFSCPLCIELFEKEFSRVKEDHLQSGDVCYIFHPVPMDLSTVQAMACLERLSESQKKGFLEAVLPEIDLYNPNVTVMLMKRALEFFGEESPPIENMELLRDSQMFEDAYRFLKQEEKVSGVPSVEINGRLYLEEVPDRAFLATEIGRRL